MSTGQWGNYTDRENRIPGRKTCPSANCPPQILMFLCHESKSLGWRPISLYT